MRVQRDHRPNQTQFDEEGRFSARTFDLEEFHSHRLCLEDLVGEVGGDTNAALSFIAFGLVNEAHPLRVQLLHQQCTEKAGVAILDKHSRARVGRSAWPAEGHAKEIDEHQRHEEQPNVARLHAEEKADVVVADQEDAFHARMPFASARWKIHDAAIASASPRTRSFNAAQLHGMSPPPDCNARSASMNQ